MRTLHLRIVALAVFLAVAVVVPRAGNARQESAAAVRSSFADVAELLADPDPARAWDAVAKLRALPLVDAKEKKAAQKTIAAWSEELTSAADESVRVLRAHALGALGELGLPHAAALVRASAADPSARVRLACALAVTELGDGADKANAKAVKPANLVGGALACASFARPGARSKVALAALEEAAEEADTLRDLILSEAALVTLEILGEDVTKLLEKREDARARFGVPFSTPVNWGGLAEQKPESFFALFKETLALAEPATLEGYAMPQALRPLVRTQHLYELYAAALGHLPRATAELLPGLLDGSIGSWDDYRKRTQPWIFTIDLLMQVEDGFLPAKARGEK